MSIDWHRAEFRRLYRDEAGPFRSLPWLVRAAAAQLLRHTDAEGVIDARPARGQATDAPLAEILGYRFGARRADRELMAWMLPLLEDGGWLRREGSALHVALPTPARRQYAPFVRLYTAEVGSFASLRWFARAAAAQLLKLCDDDGRVPLAPGGGAGGAPVALTRTLLGAADAHRDERHAIERLAQSLLDDGYLVVDGAFARVRNFASAHVRQGAPRGALPAPHDGPPAGLPRDSRGPLMGLPRDSRGPLMGLPSGLSGRNDEAGPRAGAPKSIHPSILIGEIPPTPTDPAGGERGSPRPLGFHPSQVYEADFETLQAAYFFAIARQARALVDQCVRARAEQAEVAPPTEEQIVATVEALTEDAVRTGRTSDEALAKAAADAAEVLVQPRLPGLDLGAPTARPRTSTPKASGGPGKAPRAADAHGHGAGPGSALPGQPSATPGLFDRPAARPPVAPPAPTPPAPPAAAVEAPRPAPPAPTGPAPMLPGLGGETAAAELPRKSTRPKAASTAQRPMAFTVPELMGALSVLPTTVFVSTSVLPRGLAMGLTTAIQHCTEAGITADDLPTLVAWLAADGMGYMAGGVGAGYLARVNALAECFVRAKGWAASGRPRMLRGREVSGPGAPEAARRPGQRARPMEVAPEEAWALQAERGGVGRTPGGNIAIDARKLRAEAAARAARLDGTGTDGGRA